MQVFVMEYFPKIADPSLETKVVPDSKSHGYKVKLCDVKNIDPYTCQLCNLLLREPVQTERGEVAWGRFYKQESQDNGICPIDKEPCSGVVYRDKAKQCKDIFFLRFVPIHHSTARFLVNGTNPIILALSFVASSACNFSTLCLNWFSLQ